MYVAAVIHYAYNRLAYCVGLAAGISSAFRGTIISRKFVNTHANSWLEEDNCSWEYWNIQDISLFNFIYKMKVDIIYLYCSISVNFNVCCCYHSLCIWQINFLQTVCSWHNYHMHISNRITQISPETSE